jgi:hypothetical protein
MKINLTSLFLLLIATGCRSQVVDEDKMLRPGDIEMYTETYATANLSNAIAIWEEEYELNWLLAKALSIYRTKELKMDIYGPKDEVDRPAIIFIHGGAFLPGGGSRKDDSVKFIAKEFAQRGYRVFCIDYRLMNLLTPSFVKAGYTAAQDGKAAVRFIGNHQEELHVDGDNIFVAGVSAGAITALQTVYLDTGESILGREDKLERMYGHLDGVGEDAFEAVTIRGVVSLSGGVFDPSIIDDQRILLLLVHGTEDGIVQIDCGLPFAEVLGLYNQFMETCIDRLSSYPRLVRELKEGRAVEVCGGREIAGHCQASGISVKYLELEGRDHYLLLSKNGTPTEEGEEIVGEVAAYLYELVQ